MAACGTALSVTVKIERIHESENLMPTGAKYKKFTDIEDEPGASTAKTAVAQSVRIITTVTTPR